LTLLLIEAIYANTSTLNGYAKNDMLLFLFIGQISFALNVNQYYINIEELIRSVNAGELDLILTKPIPSLFYVTFKTIGLVDFLIGAAPNLLVLGLALNWTQLNISLSSVVVGVVIMLLGVFCTHVFQFCAALPVFWIGESSNIVDLTWSFEYNIGRVFPFESVDKSFRTFFSTLVPVLISTGIATSVMLNKSDKYLMLLFVVAVSIMAFLLKSFFWNLALKNYTSASS
jgi:ABC-2 type transport system permease protein